MQCRPCAARSWLMLQALCRLTKGHDRAIGLGCLSICADWPILGRLRAVQAQLLGNLGREALPARAVLVLQPPHGTYKHGMYQIAGIGLGKALQHLVHVVIANGTHTPLFVVQGHSRCLVRAHILAQLPSADCPYSEDGGYTHEP